MARARRGVWLFGLVFLTWCSVAAVFWARTGGVGPDSVTYIDAARSIAEGHGYRHRWAYWDPVYTNGGLPTPTSMWPPGLSLAIAGGIMAGLDPVTAGRGVVFVSFALLLVLLFIWSRTSGSNVAATTCAAVALVPTPGSSFVASELPFICAATAAMLCAFQGLSTSSRRAQLGWWAAASAAAGVAFLMRYVGLAAVAAVGIIAIGAWLGGRLTLRACAAAIVPGSVMVAVTMIRNQIMSGHFGQPWPGADIYWSTLPSALKSTAAGLVRADVLDGPLRVLAVLKLAVLIGLAALAIRNALLVLRQTPPAERLDRFGPSAIMVLFGLLTAALTIAATAMNGMNVEPRYLLAMAPWMLALIAAWALSAAAMRSRRTRTLAWLACIVWIVTEAALIVPAMTTTFSNYIDAGATSGAIKWVRSNATVNEILLTNRGADLAFWAPNPVVRLPRLPHSANAVHSVVELDRLADRFGARYLVHFRGYPEDAKYSRDEFAFVRQFDQPEMFGDRVVAEFPDSIVYRVGTGFARTAHVSRQESH